MSEKKSQRRPKTMNHPRENAAAAFSNATPAQIEDLAQQVPKQRLVRLSYEALAGLPYYPVGAGRTGKEIADMKLKEQTWRIASLLQDGGVYGLITGRPFTGKSFWVLQTMHALLTGTDLLNFRVTKKHRVLLISYESSHEKIHRRIQCQGWLEELGNSALCEVFDANWPTGEDGVKALCYKIEHALHGGQPLDVIFIDPLSSFIVESQDPVVVQTITEALRLMAHKYGVAIILCGWNRKLANTLARAASSVDEVLGPTSLTGVADLVWAFDRREQAEPGTLRVAGRDMEPQTIEVRFPIAKNSPPLWQLGLVVHVRGADDDILDAIAHHGQPMTAPQLAGVVGKPSKYIGDRLALLRESGQVILFGKQGKALLYDLPGQGIEREKDKEKKEKKKREE